MKTRNRKIISANSGEASFYSKRTRKRKNNEKVEEKGPRSKLRSHLCENNVPIIIGSGKINKIILINVMAHDNLIVDFNKNVNVFIGSVNNGLSPQNTVMKAMMFALGTFDGGRSTETLKLVKRGATSGSIEIRIANDCGQAYDPETYGNQIIIRRTFSLNGTSACCIRNQSGNVISTSSEELMKILMFLNIRVDNPVCLLDLESSTAYLKESDSNKLFQFFVKATQIDDIMEKLKRCRTEYAVIENDLDEQHTLMAAVTKEKQDIEAKLNSLQYIDCKINPLKDTLHKYELELEWLKVKNEESLLQDIKDALNKHHEMHDDISQSIIENEYNIGIRRAKCTLLSKKIDQLKIIKKRSLEQKYVVKESLLKESDDLKNAEKQVKEISVKMEHKMKNINQLEKAPIGRTRNIDNDPRLQYLHTRKTSIECVRDTVSLKTEMLKNAKCTSEAKITHFHHQRAIDLENKGRISEQIRQWKPRIESNAVFLHFNESKEYLIKQLVDVEDRLFEIDLNISAEQEKKSDLSRKISNKARILNKIDEDILNITDEIQKTEYPAEGEKELQKAELERLERVQLEKELLSIQHFLGKVTSSIKEKKNTTKDIDENLREVTGQIYENQALLNSEENLLITENKTLKMQKQKDDCYTNYIETLEKHQQDCIKKISDLKHTASMLGERIEPTYVYDILSAKIIETKQMLIINDSGLDSLNNLQQKLQEKNIEYEKRGECVKKIEESLEKLRHQSQELTTLRKDISLRTRDEFKRIMKSLNSDGFIEVDFQRESLELSVISASKDIAILGFLFSLWSIVDSPFYFLDEGGVYTDAGNRAHITKLLLDEGTKNLHRQYSFITSQFLAEVANSNHITIHRLPDPTLTKLKLTKPKLAKPKLVDPKLTKPT